MSVTFQYSLAPPDSVRPQINGKAAPLADEQGFEVVVKSGEEGPVKRYYDAAVLAVREAQDALNGTFTIWKDAIGDLEKSKEVVKAERGMGKAARMMAANKAAEAAMDVEEEEEDEDGVDLAEAGWVEIQGEC